MEETRSNGCIVRWNDVSLLWYVLNPVTSVLGKFAYLSDARAEADKYVPTYTGDHDKWPNGSFFCEENGTTIHHYGQGRGVYITRSGAVQNLIQSRTAYQWTKLEKNQ